MFIFERLFNQDLDFEELLENVFEENLSSNDKKVEKFYQYVRHDDKY